MRIIGLGLPVSGYDTNNYLVDILILSGVGVGTGRV